jgi:hypothetical protein
MADAQPLDDATLAKLEELAKARGAAHWWCDVRGDGYWANIVDERGSTVLLTGRPNVDDARFAALLASHASALLHSSREAARLREENRKLRRLCHEATNFVLECRCDSIHLNRDGHDVEVWRDEFAADIRRAALQGEKTDAT